MEICDRCGSAIRPGEIRYIVQMSIAADDGGIVLDPVSDDEMETIISELDGADSVDIAKQVYESNSFILCIKCKRVFMRNPFGGKDRGDTTEGDISRMFH